MNDQIIPLDANLNDYVSENEVRSGERKLTESGKPYVVVTAGSAKEGMTAVRFEKVTEGAPGSRRSSWKHVGYKKIIIGKITGVGRSFSYMSGDSEVQYAYLEA